MKKILLVDDEKGVVAMMKSYFEMSGYQVLTAYNGAEALRQAVHQPDIILLDINMPGMDGLTVCKKIRDYISCPILFLTARIETADKINGFQAGADDYIIKPFDIDELGARVAAHLRREKHTLWPDINRRVCRGQYLWAEARAKCFLRRTRRRKNGLDLFRGSRAANSETFG